VSSWIGGTVAVVVFVVLTSSAAAFSPADAAQFPGKPELHRAGSSFAANGRGSLNLPAHAWRSRLVSEHRHAMRSRSAAAAVAALESALLARVNAVRSRHGLPGLRHSPGLTAAAAYHSRQMVQHGFFEHESRDGGSFRKRVKRFYGSRGFRAWEVGENLAYGSPDLDAAATVRMWMNSPGHRENLLAASWRELGLAAVHVDSAGGTFGGGPVTVVTLDFGLRAR
jgi:uncharacterized protein YkwD